MAINAGIFGDGTNLKDRYISDPKKLASLVSHWKELGLRIVRAHGRAHRSDGALVEDGAPHGIGLERGTRQQGAERNRGEVDGLQPVGGSDVSGKPDTLVGRLGLTGVPFVNVQNGCATGGSVMPSAACSAANQVRRARVSGSAVSSAALSKAALAAAGNITWDDSIRGDSGPVQYSYPNYFYPGSGE
mgnify:CR=1 FL=1